MDEYIKVKVKLVKRSINAALVEYEGRQTWIAYSLMHVRSENAIGRTSQGNEILLSIRDWKVEQL